MRVIGDIPHSSFKITIFSWNAKYVIKIEKGMLEQTYKLPEYEVSESEIPKLLNDVFLKNVEEHFDLMQKDLNRLLEGI